MRRLVSRMRAPIFKSLGRKVLTWAVASSVPWRWCRSSQNRHRRGVQEQPKLVGQEAMATQAVGLEFQLQLLDAVFHVALQHVDVIIDELGIAAEVGDHKALVGAQMGIFHLGDDPAGPGPGPRLVAERGEEALFLARLLVLPVRFSQERGFTTSLSRPAQGSLALRPAGWLDRPRRPWSRGFTMHGYPYIMLISYQAYRQLSGWNLPPLASRTIVAHWIILAK